MFVGSEAGDLGGGQLSLVAAPYMENGRVAGTVGVLGPTRMDYAKVMPLRRRHGRGDDRGPRQGQVAPFRCTLAETLEHVVEVRGGGAWKRMGRSSAG